MQTDVLVKSLMHVPNEGVREGRNGFDCLFAFFIMCVALFREIYRRWKMDMPMLVNDLNATGETYISRTKSILPLSGVFRELDFGEQPISPTQTHTNSVII